MMIFGFPNISAWDQRIFKIIVSIAHNKRIIILDKKKFEDLILADWDIRKLQYHHLKQLDFFNALYGGQHVTIVISLICEQYKGLWLRIRVCNMSSIVWIYVWFVNNIQGYGCKAWCTTFYIFFSCYSSCISDPRFPSFLLQIQKCLCAISLCVYRMHRIQYI